MRYLLAFLFLTATAAPAQMCGDCNGDRRVTIAELVRAVRNALEPDPLEACGKDCTQGSCGGASTCIEFPGTDTYECATSICFDTQVQYDACLELLHTTTALCYPTTAPP